MEEGFAPTLIKALESYLSAGATLVEFGTAAVRTDLAVHCRLISISESEKVAAQPKPTVGSCAPHRLVVAPLADVPASHCLSGGARPLAQHTKWYDAAAIARALHGGSPVDCLLVAGPDAGHDETVGRSGLLAFATSSLAPLFRGLVAVADTNRETEAALVGALVALLSETHSVRQFSTFALLVPTAWCAAEPHAKNACVHPLPLPPPFGGRGRVHEGFIPQGADEVLLEMTLAEAIEYCHTSPTCLGFTYRGSAALYTGRQKVWFKTTNRLKVKVSCGWFAYIKGFPADNARALTSTGPSDGNARSRKAGLLGILSRASTPSGRRETASTDSPTLRATLAPKPPRMTASGAEPKRYLVFTSAGDASVLPKWFEPGGAGARTARNWDCCISYYGSAVPRRWSEYADYYLENKGGKFENLLHVYKTHPDWVEGYDAVMVLDDDVGIDSAGINRCFVLREQFDLWLLQPAFDPAGKISHGITRVLPGPTLRYTNFIEMTCPLFEKAALDRFMAVFDPDLKGWGADWWFLQVHGVSPAELDGKVAVLDIVPCINPHDSAKPGQMREITKLQGRDARVAVWERMKSTHQLIEWQKVQFSTVWLTS